MNTWAGLCSTQRASSAVFLTERQCTEAYLKRVGRHERRAKYKINMINTRFKQNAKLPLTSTWHVSQDCKARLSLVGRLSERARCDKDSKVWEDKIMSPFFSCNHSSIPVHAADWLAPSSSTCATWTPIWIHFREQLADGIPQRDASVCKVSRKHPDSPTPLLCCTLGDIKR